MSSGILSQNAGSNSARIAPRRGERTDPAPDRGGAPRLDLGVSTAPLWKAFGAAHKAVYLGSNGRLGAKLAWIPMLLLSTRGRRTGRVRTMPLAYLPDPEAADTYVIVASNGGSEKPPAWWLNLTANNITTVQVGQESFWARAEIAPPERRGSLWQALRRKIPPYRVYEGIDREIPIVLLKRLPPGDVDTSMGGIRSEPARKTAA